LLHPSGGVPCRLFSIAGEIMPNAKELNLQKGDFVELVLDGTMGAELCNLPELESQLIYVQARIVEASQHCIAIEYLTGPLKGKIETITNPACSFYRPGKLFK
jgi:hypothetical protein